MRLITVKPAAGVVCVCVARVLAPTAHQQKHLHPRALAKRPQEARRGRRKGGFSELQKNRAQPQQKGPKIAPFGGWGRVYPPTPLPNSPMTSTISAADHQNALYEGLASPPFGGPARPTTQNGNSAHKSNQPTTYPLHLAPAIAATRVSAPEETHGSKFPPPGLEPGSLG